MSLHVVYVYAQNIDIYFLNTVYIYMCVCVCVSVLFLNLHNLFYGKYGQCCIQEAKSWTQREHHEADEKDLYSGTQSEEGILGRGRIYIEWNKHMSISMAEGQTITNADTGQSNPCDII